MVEKRALEQGFSPTSKPSGQHPVHTQKMKGVRGRHTTFRQKVVKRAAKNGAMADEGLTPWSLQPAPVFAF